MIIMKSAMNLSHGYTLITKRVVLTMGSTLLFLALVIISVSDYHLFAAMLILWLAMGANPLEKSLLMLPRSSITCIFVSGSLVE